MILYHPLPPYGKVRIKPGLLRRLGLRRSPFATIDELAGGYPYIPRHKVVKKS